MSAPLRVRGAQIPTLDGLRGIAILLVMLHHFTQAHPPAQDLVSRGLFGLFDAGWMGVDLFFVLSGFLITSILIESKHGQRYFASFYTRRTLRIFPLYYGALLVFFFVLPRLHVDIPTPTRDSDHWYFLYLTNVDIALHGWEPRTVTHFWSLAIEEHFYLFWPLVVRLLGPRALLGVCVLTWIGAAALRAQLFRMDLGPVPAYVLTPTRLDLLTAGAALSVLGHGPKGLAPYRYWIYGLGGFALGVFVVQAYQTGTIDWAVPTWWAQAFIGTTTAVLFVAAVALAVEAPRGSLVHRALSVSWLRTLGRYSYGIYIWHLAIDEICRRGAPAWGFSGHDARTTADIVFVVVQRVLLSLAVAWVSYHAFEKWFLELKPRWSEGKRAASAGGPSR